MEEVPIDSNSNETDTKFFVDDFFNNANTTGNGNETISSYQCTGATYDELKIYSYFSFWIGGIFQLVVILIFSILICFPETEINFLLLKFWAISRILNYFFNYPKGVSDWIGGKYPVYTCFKS